jgi:hypothetical protein
MRTRRQPLYPQVIHSLPCSGQEARRGSVQVRLGAMRRIGQVVGAIFLLLGVFWAGRESTHGITAFWDRWWCPIPLALIVLGFGAVLVARRPAPTA